MENLKIWRKIHIFSTDFVDYIDCIDCIDCIVDFGFDKLTEIQITEPPVLGPTVGAFYPLSLSWNPGSGQGVFQLLTVHHCSTSKGQDPAPASHLQKTSSWPWLYCQVSLTHRAADGLDVHLCQFFLLIAIALSMEPALVM